jgi:curved DNA-binding protein CbpA
LSELFLNPGVGPMTASYYEVLGISRDTSQASVRAAYLRLAQEYHPDLNGNDSLAREEFKQIQRAYEVLRNPHTRAHYDRDPEALDSYSDVGAAGSAARAKGRTGKAYRPDRYGSQSNPTGDSTARPRDPQTPWASLRPDARQSWRQHHNRKFPGSSFAVTSIGLSVVAISLIAYNMISQRKAVLAPNTYGNSLLTSAQSLAPEGAGPRVVDPSDGSAASAMESTEGGSFGSGDSPNVETVVHGADVQADGAGTVAATFRLVSISELPSIDALGVTLDSDFDFDDQGVSVSEIGPAMNLPLSPPLNLSTDSPGVDSRLSDPAPPLLADMEDTAPPTAPAFTSVEPLDDEGRETEFQSRRGFEAQANGGASRRRTDAAQFDSANRANERFDSPFGSPSNFGDSSRNSSGSFAPRGTWSNGANFRAAPRGTAMPPSSVRGASFFSPLTEPVRRPNSRVSRVPATGITSGREFQSQNSGFHRGNNWPADAPAAFQPEPSIPVTGRMSGADFSIGPNHRDLLMPRGIPSHGNVPAMDRGVPLLQPYSRPGWPYGQFSVATPSGADQFSDQPVSPALPSPYRTGIDSGYGSDTWTSSRSAYDGLWQDDGDFPP